MPTSICRSIVTICSGLYLLIGMTRFSSKWILSHSTWYKFCRSRQNYKECLDNVGKSLKGENKITMWNYQQKYQSRVMGMRTALIHRLGGRDTKQDFYYDSAASDSGSIQDLRGISTDLRNLAGEVLALRGN
jgi:hypothetical protein